MENEVNKTLSKSLNAENLQRIRQTLKDYLKTPNEYGEDYKYWKSMFQLCRDVPLLLDMIDSLRIENAELTTRLVALQGSD